LIHHALIGSSRRVIEYEYIYLIKLGLNLDILH